MHGLTYYVPVNWEFDSEASSENLKYYVRYNNWGDFIAVMAINYIGDTNIISVDEAISDYTDDYNDALVTSQVIDEQNFTIISYIRESDNNYCRVYITEHNSSVFQVYFRFAAVNSKNKICDEIVDAIAFDEYVNPKEALDEGLKRDLNKLLKYSSYINGAESAVLRDYPTFDDDKDCYYQENDHLFEIEGILKFEYFKGKITAVRFTWVPDDWHRDEEYVVECLKKYFGDFPVYTELLDDKWFCYSWYYTTADNLKVSYYISEDEGEIIIRVK